MVQDKNFINQVRLFLDKKLHDNLNFILNIEAEKVSYLSNQEFYIVCYALHVIKSYKKSNQFILTRSDKLEDFKLKKKFLRLQIFNHFYLNNKDILRSLIISSLELGSDIEVLKIFYLSIKSISDYKFFLETMTKFYKTQYINLKEADAILSFFQSNYELTLQTLILQKLFKNQPDNINILNNLAASYFNLKKFTYARKYYEKLLKLNYSNETLLALVNINNILRNNNRSKEYLKQVLENNSNDCMGLYFQQEMETSDKNIEVLIDTYENILKATPENFPNKFFLFLSLSKLYEKNKNYKKSFENIEKFNHNINEKITYDIDKVKKESYFFLKNFSNKELFLKIKNFKSSQSQKKPIFILGLPRSGTTLVEHILGAHSEIQHFGERDYFFKNFKFLFDIYNLNNNKKILNNLSVEDFLQYGDHYKNYFKLYYGKKFFTDKMPFNFLYIGLIKYALPDSKIIICSRDYRDVGLSIYKNFFAEEVNFSYSKKNIIEYIKIYHSTINAWMKIFDQDIFIINYSNLITDPNHSIQNLLNYCSLPFEESCLEFHKKNLVADTVSLHQVNNPIYDKSVDNWKNYNPYLKDFFDALECIK